MSLVNFNFNNTNICIFTENTNSPLFVAKDVASILGYKRPNDAINSFCKGAVKYRTLKTNGGDQEVRVIEEPDMYRLIFGSKLEGAIKFQDWVFNEVLPSIRKTGTYTLTINANQQRHIQSVVNALVQQTGTHHQTFYHNLKSRFNIAKYDQLPSIKFDECVNWLQTEGVHMFTPKIKSREDLSFTAREQSGRLNNWHIEAPKTYWHDGIATGKAMFEEVKQLAKTNAEEARYAIVFALSNSKEFDRGNSNFSDRGRGEEMGFTMALAQELFKSNELSV